MPKHIDLDCISKIDAFHSRRRLRVQLIGPCRWFTTTTIYKKDHINHASLS